MIYINYRDMTMKLVKKEIKVVIGKETLKGTQAQPKQGKAVES
jgi:hypothetical protein